jgi:undecaprenyl-diphosphatase
VPAALRRSPALAPAESSAGADWLPWLMAGIAAFVLAAVLLDANSVGWVAALPDWLVSVFQAITVAGKSNWYLIPTGAALIVLVLGDWGSVGPSLRAAWCELASLIAFAFASVAAAAIAVNLVKQIIGRARPVLFERDGWLAFDPFNFDYANASFPSGHATTAGAVTMAAMLILPRFRWPILAAGLLIALSRVVVGAHYPSDTIAGLALGAGIAYALARFLLRRQVAFRVDDAGRVRPRLAQACAAFRETPRAVAVAPLRAIVARAR